MRYKKIYVHIYVLFMGGGYGINKKTEGNLHKTADYKG